MTSNEVANTPPSDRNAEIAEASERQHRVNVKRALHYLGLDPYAKPDVYSTEDIYRLVEPLVNTPAQSTIESSSQLALDQDVPAEK